MRSSLISGFNSMATNPDSKQLLDPVALLDEHGEHLYRFALLRTRDGVTAEDLVQETLRAAGGGDKCADLVCERRWLEEIMKQKIRDHFRNSQSVETDSAIEYALLDVDSFERSGEWVGHWREDRAPVEWPLKASELIQSPTFSQAFDQCLSNLPRRAVIAFKLREIDGFSSEEVCDLLGIIQGDLWVMLHCVRAKLRQTLEQEFFRGHDLHSLSQRMAAPSSKNSARYPSVAA